MGEFPIITLNMAIPNGIGLMEIVWLHITLKNGKYVPIKGIYLFQYPSHNGKEWPKIFDENTKKKISTIDAVNNIFNSSEFSFQFEAYDNSYYQGTYVCTFTINEKSYYTERYCFSFKKFNPRENDDS